MMSQNSVHASLYSKMIIKTLIGHLLCNSFTLENSGWDIDVKSHCLLFYGTKPLDNNKQSNQTYPSQADRKAWASLHGEGLML